MTGGFTSFKLSESILKDYKYAWSEGNGFTTLLQVTSAHPGTSDLSCQR